MENKTLTAVEWLEQEIVKLNIKIDDATQVSSIRIFEQAKQMEKEQIIKFANDYLDDDTDLTAEQYYNETYGSITPELRYKDGTQLRKYNSPKLQAIENELSTQKEMSDDLLTEEEIAEFKRELKEVMKKPKTEISDEEIENEAERYEKVDGINSFKEAIKWYREQFKKK